MFPLKFQFSLWKKAHIVFNYSKKLPVFTKVVMFMVRNCDNILLIYFSVDILWICRALSFKSYYQLFNWHETVSAMQIISASYNKTCLLSSPLQVTCLEVLVYLPSPCYDLYTILKITRFHILDSSYENSWLS